MMQPAPINTDRRANPPRGDVTRGGAMPLAPPPFADFHYAFLFGLWFWPNVWLAGVFSCLR